jgi:hypothetical protein
MLVFLKKLLKTVIQPQKTPISSKSRKKIACEPRLPAIFTFVFSRLAISEVWWRLEILIQFFQTANFQSELFSCILF